VACDLCFTGRRIETAEAEQLGVATSVVLAAAVLDTAVELAAEIATAQRDSLRRLKEKALARGGTVQGDRVVL
jgi:enoyl-CoA hydratase/carnithine racemase